MADFSSVFPNGFDISNKPQQDTYTDKISGFLDACSEFGLIIDNVDVSGDLIRVDVVGEKRGKKSGWYAYYDDHSVCSAVFGNWKTDQSGKWCSKEISKLSQEELSAYDKRREQDREQREKNKEQNYKINAQISSDIYMSCNDVQSHPYLVEKQISGIVFKENKSGSLVIPVTDIDGNIQSIQTINRSGTKSFKSGAKASGGMFQIGAPTNTIYVSEGVATAASIHQMTSNMSVCCFTCHNIYSVAKDIKTKYPNSKVVICADNDVSGDTNIGLEKAMEAGNSLGLKVIYPEFSSQYEGTDFNDLYRIHGKDHALKQILDNSNMSISTSTLAKMPEKPISWVLQDVLTMSSTSMIFARGGAGKSYWIQHLCSCIATGLPFFDIPVTRGNTLSIYCEDDIDEYHRRQTAICENHDIPYEALKDSYVINRVGNVNNFLITFNARGVGELTDFYNDLDAEMSKIKPIFMTIDTSGDVFAGNENDKSHVNQFLKGCIATLASKHECHIMITGHVPKADGAQFSGHMSWENSVRHRVYIDYEGGGNPVRTVHLAKTNRGSEKELHSLVWSNGCLIRAANTSFAKKLIDERVQTEFLKQLESCNQSELNVSDNPRGNYAPKVFNKKLSHRNKKDQISIEDFEKAMYQLMDDGVVEVTDGHRRSKGNRLQQVKPRSK